MYRGPLQERGESMAAEGGLLDMADKEGKGEAVIVA